MMEDDLDRDSIAFQYAMFMQDCWRKEIERAINEVKNSGKRSDLDKWFRKRFYIVQGSDRKREKFESGYGALRHRGRVNERLVGPGGSKDERSRR